MTNKTAPACRYCAQGHVANEKGDHWIVKSIIPARIDIRKCTRSDSLNTRTLSAMQESLGSASVNT